MSNRRIFISYRRGPDSASAGRLHDRLERIFDSSSLFYDIDSIPPGVDLHEYIDKQVTKCHCFLAVIGPGWLSDIERLSNENDFVRIEIASAMRHSTIPIIPVLVQGAVMPDPVNLPQVLEQLPRRSGISIPHDHFAAVVDGRLAPAIKAALPRRNPLTIFYRIFLLLLLFPVLGSLLIYFWPPTGFRPSDPGAPNKNSTLAPGQSNLDPVPEPAIPSTLPNLEIYYYRKSADGDVIASALRDAGVEYQEASSETHPQSLKSNALACSSNLEAPISDIKNLAKLLIGHGVPLQVITPFRDSAKSPRRVEIVTNASKINGESVPNQSAPLTVDQINALDECKYLRNEP